ncbi:NAD(P)H-dependent oxidoreductase [Solidesulfovibrio sp. C21]|uniref:NAD(P)H-dependent oxidoreductase n=1 Tax=Solidesulfovibrio sp. C21 TaxID=3398613 RepID=UPI0039FC33E7
MAKICLFFDGLGQDWPAKDVFRGLVRETAQEAGYVLDVVDVERLCVSPCKGCFGCWMKTPGRCLIDDPCRELVGRLVASDAVVFASPVVFGGLSGQMKMVLERCVLPALLPFFHKVAGRTRHPLRYGRNPDIMGLGLLPQHDAAQEQLFRALIDRNAANMGAQRRAACVVQATDTPEIWRAKLKQAFSFGQRPAPTTPPTIVICNGSPKRTGSVSGILGNYLAKCLSARGARTETVSLLEAAGKAEVFDRLVTLVEQADGVALAFPLYGDFLPGHVTAVLSHLAALGPGTATTRQTGFVAIANCGFPEARNNDAALEGCRLAASQLGFAWLGGVSVGGGGFYTGRELEKFGFMGRRVRWALEKKAALLVGQATESDLSSPNIQVPCPMPGWLYLRIAEMGWKKSLRTGDKTPDPYARPYEAKR